MSNDNSTGISFPGEGWRIKWYSGGTLRNFELDLIGFLAILGEGSILSIAQVSALSRLFFLPRLLPAPQALLRPSRPLNLETTPARVIGVHSGNRKDHMHHIAHILLDTNMSPYSVRCVNVTKKGIMDGKEITDSKQSKMSPGTVPEVRTPPVKAKATGPLSMVTIFGSSLSVILLILSIVFGDGMSLYATILLSSLSTLIGISNKYELQLPTHGGANDEKSVIVRYPNGSYLVVHCDEKVARELFFAPEEVHYLVTNDAVYRLISLLGTLMLMLGVIALGNAQLELQFAWAGAYITLNIAHWIAAALPKRKHWDLSCYNVKEEGIQGGPENKNFTQALGKVILVTKQIEWLETEDVPPRMGVWGSWADHMFADARAHSWVEGRLQKPAFRSTEGVVWTAPEGWDPKQVWDTLKRDDKRRKEEREAEEGSRPSQSGTEVDTVCGASRTGTV